MQKLLAASVIAAGVLLSGAAQANPDLAKAQCGKCHEMDKKKGPSYKQTAADYKGKADAEATLFKKITDPKGDHPEMKATPEETRTVLKWILQQ